jgi:flotillin
VAGARAAAAPVLETGKATAQALALVAEQWGHAGAVGRELFVLQHLDELVARASERVAKSTIAELNVVDGGDGASFTGAVALYPAAVARVLESIGAVLGVDMARLLQGRGAEQPLAVASFEAPPGVLGSGDPSGAR